MSLLDEIADICEDLPTLLCQGQVTLSEIIEFLVWLRQLAANDLYLTTLCPPSAGIVLQLCRANFGPSLRLTNA